jgi:hypothetical protein
MVVIQIREETPASTSTNGSNGADTMPTEVQATISFDHGPLYPITVRNPFSEENERVLEWYFEEHLHSPFTNQVKALNAGKSITTYGESLFNQVFADRNAFAKYKQ